MSLVRFIQGPSYHLAEWHVGVMNVYEDGPGQVVAHLAVYEPATAAEEDLRVRPDDEITIGTQRYRVAALDIGTPDEPAWVDLMPVPA